MEETKVSKKKIITILLTVLMVSLIVFLAVFYIWKMNYYKTHFLPNTYVNGVDCSELDAAAVAEIIKADVAEYKLTVMGRDENGTQVELGVISAEDIGLEPADAMAEAQELLGQQKPGNWLAVVLSKQHNRIHIPHTVEYDKDALKKHVMQWDAFDEENMIAPVDAYVSKYKEELK